MHELEVRSLNNLWDDISKLWFTIYPQERRMVIDNERTAAYAGVFEDHLKLMYGKPSD